MVWNRPVNIIPVTLAARWTYCVRRSSEIIIYTWHCVRMAMHVQPRFVVIFWAAKRLSQNYFFRCRWNPWKIKVIESTLIEWYSWSFLNKMKVNKRNAHTVDPSGDDAPHMLSSKFEFLGSMFAQTTQPTLLSRHLLLTMKYNKIRQQTSW